VVSWGFAALQIDKRRKKGMNARDAAAPRAFSGKIMPCRIDQAMRVVAFRRP
jgi:hypothetical protein